MSYLFDTNIIIGFLKNDTNIVSNLSSEQEVNISVVTVGEMLFGANNSGNPIKNKKLYTEFFKHCIIHSITEKTSEYYAEIRYSLKIAGNPIPENDIWIAAIAKEKNMTIVTRDKHLNQLECIKTEIW